MRGNGGVSRHLAKGRGRSRRGKCSYAPQVCVVDGGCRGTDESEVTLLFLLKWVASLLFGSLVFGLCFLALYCAWPFAVAGLGLAFGNDYCRYLLSAAFLFVAHPYLRQWGPTALSYAHRLLWVPVFHVALVPMLRMASSCPLSSFGRHEELDEMFCITMLLLSFQCSNLRRALNRWACGSETAGVAGAELDGSRPDTGEAAEEVNPDSSTPEPPLFETGEDVYYASSDGSVMLVKILEVHLDDDLFPYYTIQIEEGREKQTDEAQLTRRHPDWYRRKSPVKRRSRPLSSVIGRLLLLAIFGLCMVTADGALAGNIAVQVSVHGTIMAGATPLLASCISPHALEDVLKPAAADLKSPPETNNEANPAAKETPKYYAPADWETGPYHPLLKLFHRGQLKFRDEMREKGIRSKDGKEPLWNTMNLPWHIEPDADLKLVAWILHYQTKEAARGLKDLHTASALRSDGTLREHTWECVRQGVGPKLYWQMIHVDMIPVAINFDTHASLTDELSDADADFVMESWTRNVLSLLHNEESVTIALGSKKTAELYERHVLGYVPKGRKRSHRTLPKVYEENPLKFISASQHKFEACCHPSSVYNKRFSSRMEEKCTTSDAFCTAARQFMTGDPLEKCTYFMGIFEKDSAFFRLCDLKWREGCRHGGEESARLLALAQAWKAAGFDIEELPLVWLQEYRRFLHKSAYGGDEEVLAKNMMSKLNGFDVMISMPALVSACVKAAKLHEISGDVFTDQVFRLLSSDDQALLVRLKEHYDGDQEKLVEKLKSQLNGFALSMDIRTSMSTLVSACVKAAKLHEITGDVFTGQVFELLSPKDQALHLKLKEHYGGDEEKLVEKLTSMLNGWGIRTNSGIAKRALVSVTRAWKAAGCDANELSPEMKREYDRVLANHTYRGNEDKLVSSMEGMLSMTRSPCTKLLDEIIRKRAEDTSFDLILNDGRKLSAACDLNNVVKRCYFIASNLKPKAACELDPQLQRYYRVTGEEWAAMELPEDESERKKQAKKASIRKQSNFGRSLETVRRQLASALGGGRSEMASELAATSAVEEPDADKVASKRRLENEALDRVEPPKKRFRIRLRFGRSLIGLRAEVKFSDGQFYPGTIIGVTELSCSECRVAVFFDDGTVEQGISLPGEDVRLMRGRDGTVIDDTGYMSRWMGISYGDSVEEEDGSDDDFVVEEDGSDDDFVLDEDDE